MLRMPRTVREPRGLCAASTSCSIVQRANFPCGIERRPRGKPAIGASNPRDASPSDSERAMRDVP
jgi:hypothetical protein